MSINNFTLRCSFCSSRQPAFVSFQELDLRVEKQNGKLFIVFSCPNCGSELLQHTLKSFDCSTMSIKQKDKLYRELQNNPSDLPDNIVDKGKSERDRTINFDKLREWLSREAELSRGNKTKAIIEKNGGLREFHKGALAQIKRVAKAMDWGEFEMNVQGGK